jgi:hypothetical protein
MKANMGGLDRSIRIIVAITVGILYWQNLISGTLAYILLAVAAILVLTSLISFCPLYAIFRLNTCVKNN